MKNKKKQQQHERGKKEEPELSDGVAVCPSDRLGGEGHARFQICDVCAVSCGEKTTMILAPDHRSDRLVVVSLKPCHIRSDHIRSHQVRSDQIRSDHVESL